MPTGEQFLGAGHRIKLGQGYRGRLPGGGAGGLHPPPGIPHIRPRPAPINFGAVAQVGRQQRQAPPPNPLQPRHMLPQGFGPLPSTRMPQLNKHERQAIKAIKQSYNGNYKDPGRKANALIFNPTPKMVQHLNNIPGGHLAHKMAVRDAQAAPSWTGQLGKATKHLGGYQGLTPSQAQDAYTARHTPEIQAAGLPGLPGLDNPVTRWGQRFMTDEAETIKQAPGGILELGKHGLMGLGNVAEGAAQGLGITHPGGMQGGVSEITHPHYFASQKPFFKEQGKAVLKSYKDMFTTDMIISHPGLFFNNAASIASFGAGTGLRVARIGAVARDLRAGTITADEALSRTAQIIRRPGPVQRQMLYGKADVHFDKNGFDKLGFHKRDFQTSPPWLDGHYPSLPIFAHTKHPEESLVGIPGGMHAEIHEGWDKGLTQATGIIDPETGHVVRVNMIGKGGGMAHETEKALHDKLVDLANEKLHEAKHDPYVRPAAFKSALGGLIQKYGWDPLTERAHARAGGRRAALEVGREIPAVRGPLLGAGLSGKLGKLKRQDIEMQQNMARAEAEVREARRLGIPGPYDKPQSHHVAMPTGEGPLTQEQWYQSLSKKEQKQLQDLSQANAYAIGPMKVHAESHQELWDNGLDAKDTILKHPQDYIGIKQVPSKAKKPSSYAGEKRIAESWHSMVEHNPDRMLANPDAYRYYPRSMWQRLKPGEPGRGPMESVMKGIDAVTQMVRSGRFLTPAYAAWFLQNGVLHLSQAGVYTLRNANLLRTEFDKMSPEMKANFDGASGASHYGGGIARTGEGSETTPFLHPRIKTFTHKMAKIWHAIDDRPWRRMSFIHELEREGYHGAEGWERLFKEDPAKFRAIARRGQKEAIDYSEMGPAERATFQKLFTAWGWTRGASTYTGRFPFQHPVQAGILNQAGQQGQKNLEDWWLKHGGISPQWLEDYIPLTGDKHPLMGSTSILSPGETLSSVLESVPGATIAQRASLSEEESPAIGFLEQAVSGRDRFGRPLVGLSGRVGGPLGDLVHRFRPYGMLETLIGSHHGGGTFLQGPAAFGMGLTGLGLQRLRAPDVAAALGVKDYEQALPKPDEIRFRHEWGLKTLPRQLKLYEKMNGAPMDASSIAQLKGDMDAVENRDLFQYQWAHSRGANSFRSLPATDRAKAGIKFMRDHGVFTQQDAIDAQDYMNEAKTERNMDQVASEIWAAYPVGRTVNQWNSMMRRMQPSPLEASRG